MLVALFQIHFGGVETKLEQLGACIWAKTIIFMLFECRDVVRYYLVRLFFYTFLGNLDSKSPRQSQTCWGCTCKVIPENEGAAFREFLLK